MTDYDVELALERVHAFRGMLIEAAFQDELLWRNVASLAGLSRDEELIVRVYLLEAYGPDGGRRRRDGLQAA